MSGDNGMVHIDYEKCINCGQCAEFCPAGAICQENEKIAVGDECILCGNCAKICPSGAVFMESLTDVRQMSLDAYSGIWVIVENCMDTGEPMKVSYELLSEARILADQLGEDVWAVDLCMSVGKRVIDDLQRLGTDHLLVGENDVFKQYHTDTFAAVLTKWIERYRPSVVLFPGTENGRDLAPRIAARLQVGLTADCTGFEINASKELVQVRPAYGGNVIASIVTPNHRPQMASVRPNVFQVIAYDRKKMLDIQKPDIEICEERVRCTGIEKVSNPGGNLEEAKIVTVGGYGLGKEGFLLLHLWAERIGAAVGATRKAVDEGWAPFEIQIGQTGKMISPEICICFGVSGSLQHMIGIKKAKKIIAVNNDPNAHIFSVSDKAILGDCKEILTALLQK